MKSGIRILLLKEILKFPEGWEETLSDGERYYERLIDEQGEKEVYDMCQAFEDMVEEGRIEGRIEGREQGKREILQDNIRKMYKKGITPEFIADVLEKDLELVKELLAE